MPNYKPHINYIFDQLGLPRHLDGYNHAYNCVEYFLNNPDIRKMEAAYVDSAKKLNTTRSAAERCIRHLIDFTTRGPRTRTFLDLFRRAIACGKITNKEFILTICVEVRRRMEEMNVNN